MQVQAKLLASIIVVSILIILNFFPHVFSQWFTQLQEAILKGGVIMFLLVMIIQSLVSVIPAEAVLIVGSSAFGFAVASAAAVVGLMAGALINYAIGFIFGRPIVEKIISAMELERIERIFNKHGVKMIFVFRFIPWVSFDAISYFSGIAGVSVTAFTLATLLGTIPRALFYSYLGEKIGLNVGKGDTSLLNYLLLATLLIIVALIIFSEKLPRRSEEA
ncbi:MAG: VTT domain-containing protein [Thermoproteota archaeon]